MRENNKGGKIFKSAAGELNELAIAFEKAGWDPEHPEEFDLFKNPQILEEFPDPILYILQVFHGTDIPIAYYLQDLLKTNVTYKDAETLILQAKEDATDPESATFTELTKAYRVTGSIVLFCLAHGVDPVRVSLVKNLFNVVRFPEELFTEGADLATVYALCKKIESEFGLKELLYKYLTQDNIGFFRPGQQTNGVPLEPELNALKSDMIARLQLSQIAA